MHMKKYKALLLLIVGFFAGYLFSILLPVVLAHGGDTNLIHGCVRNNGLLAGFVRIVGANTNCANNETPLDWKQGLNNPPFACVSCDFTNPLTVGSRFAGKDLTNSYLAYSILTQADLSGTIFINAELTGTVLSATNLSNANFTGANLSGTSVNLANFLNTNLTNANLTSADLFGATNMDTATLTGVTWSNTTCPDGTNSDNNGNTCVGHLTP
jgi:uncharacterized protein YjbI with pentapeptide repeats